jgi:hypothetical protein
VADVPRGDQREVLHQGGGQGKVAGGEHAHPGGPGPGIDLCEVFGGQAGGADDHRHAARNRRLSVGLHCFRMGVIDEDVGAFQCRTDVICHLEASGGPAQQFPDVLASGLARQSAGQFQVTGIKNARRNGLAGPAGRPGHCHLDHRVASSVSL